MKKTIASITLLLAAFVAFAVSPLVAANNSSVTKNSSTQIAGTIFGQFDLSVGAWVGHAMISIGNQAPKMATFVCWGTGGDGGQDKVDGMFYGNELLTLTFMDGSGSFDLTGTFHATPEGAPGYYHLHEVSIIGNGTGDYAGISGNATSEGPFMGSPLPFDYGVNLLCISAVHGQVSGLKVQ